MPWASSLRDYNTLCPNMLLYWDAIQLHRRALPQVFDMGRSTPNEGTFKFKAAVGRSAGAAALGIPAAIGSTTCRT